MVEHEMSELSAHYAADYEARGTRGLGLAYAEDANDKRRRLFYPLVIGSLLENLKTT